MKYEIPAMRKAGGGAIVNNARHADRVRIHSLQTCGPWTDKVCRARTW
jgi:hypothetical protein